MKEDEKILEKAVKALKNEKVPSGPSKELTNVTVEKLNRISEQPNMIEFEKQVHISEGINIIKSLAKFAVAAVLLIIVGFAAGRLSNPQPPDMEEIRAALEPAIRDQLRGEMKQYLQLGLTNSYVRLKDDLTEQYRRDLSQLAANIVNASGTVTNQLLQDLIESIDEAQAKERQWFAAALEQIELNRRRDNAQFGNALASFAVRTEDELLQTKQNVEQLLSHTRTDSLVPNEFENSNNNN
jgi:hypothetical protein